MAVSINPSTQVITIPQADLTNVSGTLYSLDTNALREEIIDLLDSEPWIPFPDVFAHNTEVTIAGVTYARFIEVVNGWSFTFEDGAYSVLLTGSNNNIWDIQNGILNQNQVQVIPQNSAGLITVVSGSGVTEQDKTDIRAGLAQEATSLEILSNTDATEGKVGQL
jgi:hypothetical protein